MARYQPTHQGLKRVPVDFDRHVIRGSVEHALCHLVDNERDLTAFNSRYRNDDNGALAFDPAVFIKIALLAYRRGMISRRKKEAACRENVLFIAVSGDSQPHFTTLAAFISERGDSVATLFLQGLLIGDRQGLIGRELVAIAGVKRPSNASKANSGTRKDFQRQLTKRESAARKIVDKHGHADSAPSDAAVAQRDAKKLARLQEASQPLRDGLENDKADRTGAQGAIRWSNRTDNEAATMATSKGVMQGSTGVAAVDQKTRIIREAPAHGTGSEQALLEAVVTATDAYRAPTPVAADAGYHAQAPLKPLAAQPIDADIPDNGYRQRDERYAEHAIHKATPDPRWDKSKPRKKPTWFSIAEFTLADDHTPCGCPAGKRLYRTGANGTSGGYAAMTFTGAQQACVPCERRDDGLRQPDNTKTRHVAFLQGQRGGPSETDKMKINIDSDTGRHLSTRRGATVEPVFGHLRGNKRLHRFTLRGKTKVDGQWKLYCMLHNIEQLANHGYAVH